MKFVNVKTGESVTFTAEQDAGSRQAHIAAYLNSSDMSPNALKGQDFGWRLDPEVKSELERIRSDASVLDEIGRRIGVAIDDIRDFHIVDYIADREFTRAAVAQREATATTKYEEEYEARLKQLRQQRQEGTTVSDKNNGLTVEPSTTSSGGAQSNKKGK